MSRSEYDEHLPLFSPEDYGEKRGSGILCAVIPGYRTPCHLPLESVCYQASAAEQAGQVTVEQRFRNSYDRHIEAVYTFPLSGRAAVSDFELRIGERVIKGSVKERRAAAKDYRRSLAEGRQAALLEQERDEVFTVQVGNIPPGESVTARLTYSERLLFFEDGTTELRLPLVTAPKYIPGAPLGLSGSGAGSSEDTDMVPDASRITPFLLAQGSSGGVELDISVTIFHSACGESFIEPSEISCSQHAVQADIDKKHTVITLADDNELMDRDFVLRWKCGGEEQRSSLWSFHDEETDETFGMVTVIPPHGISAPRAPRDLVFLLDRSGSMEGLKMESAKKACSLLLSTLKPCDRFAILAFDSFNEWMGNSILHSGSPQFLKADALNIIVSGQFLNRIRARGGTETYEALKSATAFLSDQYEPGDDRVPVIVLITDGQSGNEMQILQFARQQLGTTRLFTVGIDTAVNKGFLEHLSRIGRGTSSCVEPGAALEQALLRISDEIGDAFVKEITISDLSADIKAGSITPSGIIDLFAGRPSTIFFRMGRQGSVMLKGRYHDGTEYREVLSACPGAPAVVRHLWARSRTSDLEDLYHETLEKSVLKKIVRIGEHYNVLSKFTAFTAVDRSVIVNPAGRMDVIAQPVCYPAGWSEPGRGSYSGGGCIKVDLLPCERKKFGFNPIALLLGPLYLLCLPFVLLFRLYELIRTQVARSRAGRHLGNAGPAGGSTVIKVKPGRRPSGAENHVCPPELMTHRQPAAGKRQEPRLTC